MLFPVGFDAHSLRQWQQCPAAIMRLGCLAESAEREETHVAACNALLDRGVGKPLQPVVSDVSGLRRHCPTGRYIGPECACARPSWCDPAGESPAQVRPKRAAW